MKEATGLDEQPYSLSSRPPAVPFHQSSVNSRVSPDRHGHASSGRGVLSDVVSLSARQHASGYKSIPSAPSSEQLTSYKRLVQGDVAKQTGADVPGRHSHSRLVRTRSKDSTSDPTAHTQYVALCPSGTKVRRTKVSKKERSDKPIAPRVSRSDMELSTLTRRSNTFVVDSVSKSPSSGLANQLEVVNPDVNHQGSKEKLSELRRGEASHTAPDAVLKASERLLKKQEILSRLSERLSNEFEELPEESALPRKSKVVKEKLVLGREGARNPVQERKMAARPKSAGQLRYYNSDGSDDSSLDGEIEIVDIDKELQADPSEPAPYYSGMEPLQIPEVVVHTHDLQTSPPLFNRFRPKPSKQTQKNIHQQLQQNLHQQLHPQQEASYKQRPVGYRKRHGSGESELSAFSDTIVNPSNAHARRRFMSDPDIENGPSLDKGVARTDNHVDVGVRNNGVSHKPENVTKRLSLQDGTEPFASAMTSAMGRASRDRLYSDAMERVLSRYSEMAVRERPDESSGKPKSKTLRKLPGTVPASTFTPGNTSATFGNSRGLPPRKLKPIARRSDSEIS